jgi:predicted component of type VI protein secretion system
MIFNASQVFLSFVKKALDSEEWDFESGILCTVSCAAAIEATVNQLLQEDGRIKGWDELKIKSKIDNIANFNKQKIDWGSSQWQTVNKIIQARNYLVHFKGENLGLFGTPQIEDVFNNFTLKKQSDDRKDISLKYDFSREKIRQYYDDSRSSLKELVLCTQPRYDIYDFLSSENYDSFTIY